MGKPRKKHVLQSVVFSFFVFSSFLASRRGDIRDRMGKPRKNHVLQSVVASHRGDTEARMGKPRKNHVLQSVCFSFFPPSLPPTGVT